MTLHIAVTGATGFVGKALVPLLLARGHKVSALVRNPSRVDMALPVTWVKGDLADASALNMLMRGADVVLHVAGAISAPSKDGFFKANVEGTRAVALAAVANKLRRFVHVSSLAAREPGLGFYGESKADSEVALRDFASGMAVCVLRPAAVYGPGDVATLPLLQQLLAKRAFIPGTAQARFGMVHVVDVACALADAAEGAQTGCFELDDGAGGHSWPDVVGMTQKEFGRPNRVLYIPRGVAVLLGQVGDGIAKLRGKPSPFSAGQMRQLYHADWRVKSTPWVLTQPVPLPTGLVQTIRWYQAQGLLPKTG
jgi:nucleoside-diphosphate-sugar epimerase